MAFEEFTGVNLTKLY